MPPPESTLKTELLPHQQRVVDKIQRPDQPGLVVAHGLGSGKTLTSIAAQHALNMPSTVVAPAALLGNYKKEQAKHLQGPRPETHLQSTQLAARRGEVAPNPLLIVDEAHRLRDTSTASYQAVANNQADKRLLLTGSPFYNHPSDISPLINLAAGEQVLPADRAAFEKRYITEKRVDPSLWGRFVRGETGGSTPELNQARAQELRQTFGKWVDHHPGSTENFPEVTHQTIQVPMEQDQLGTYDALLGRAPPWVAAKVRSGLPPSKREAQQLNSFLTGARQVANTTAPFQQEGGQSPKIQRAFQELQQTLGSNERAKAVVYSNYLDAGLSPYKQHLQDAKIPYGEFTGELPSDARNQLVKDYNDNKLRVLLLSSAGGEGLDLKGTRLLQVLEPHWNSEKLKQVEGRGARYKSHEGLPPEEQKLLVQHFLSTRPASGILERLNVRKSGHSVDEYLDTMSKNKEHLIDQFKGLLPQEKTAFKLQGHIDHQGLNIAVENRKGSVRSGVDKDGKPWRTVMKHPYGYIKNTKGADGDEVDVYVGPDKKALNAYVVHQHKSDGKGYDEDKVMLGFPSRAAAEKAYLAHYNDPKFLGPISEVPMEKLKGLVEEGKQMKKISMDAFFSELAKIGAISDEQARGSLERLDTLERNKPTMGQMGRYAGLGAVTAPAMGMISTAIRSGGKALVEGGTVKDKLRSVAADAAKGAVGMGAMPLLRSHLDRRAEVGTLKNYMQQPHELPSASPGPPGTEVMGKVAFSPMSELKLMGRGVRKAAIGARDFLATPMKDTKWTPMPSIAGKPAGTRKAALEGGGFIDLHVPAKPPNMQRLMNPGQKAPEGILRGGELLLGSRLKMLRDGEQYWGGKAQQELGQAPSMINGMFDPTVSADQLRGLGQGLQSAKDRAAPLQARAAAFGEQTGSEANKVVGTRLAYGAGTGGYLYAATRGEEKPKRRTVR